MKTILMTPKAKLALLALLVIAAVALGTYWIRAPVQVAKADEASSGAQILSNSISAKNSAQDVAVGGSLYAAHCAACHGADLEGQPDWQTQNDDGTFKAPPHDDSGHTWHHDDATLFSYTKLGGKALMAGAGVSDFASGMPGFGGVLSDDEIHQVLTYIKSRWSARPRKVQRERTRAAG